MNTQVSVIVSANVQSVLKIAYDTLLSVGKISKEFPPYMDDTLFFAYARLLPPFYTRECDCLINIKKLNETQSEMFVSCDFTSGNIGSKGVGIQLMAYILKTFSQKFHDKY